MTDFRLSAEVDDTGRRRIRCWIDRPVDECYRRFCDVEAIPFWLWVVGRVDVRERDEHGRALVADFIASLQQDSVAYTLRYTYEDVPGRREVRWAPIAGDVEVLAGSASFAPHADGGCALLYCLECALSDGAAEWADDLYNIDPAETAVSDFCEWLCSS